MSDQDDLPAETAPENIMVSVRGGFETEDSATEFAHSIAASVRAISRYIDLTTLDGITIAADYNDGLCSLDRGFDTSDILTPSDEYGFGVAMTPLVRRGQKIKSHIICSLESVRYLPHADHEFSGHGLHILTHECAHVEIHQAFDKAFPNFLLNKRPHNLHDHIRWKAIKSCWEEYAACSISGAIGYNPAADYQEIFLEAVKQTRDKSNESIIEYRNHGNVQRGMNNVYLAYSRILKFASYLLGAMHGLGLSLNDFPETKKALDGHWFLPHFIKLDDLCQMIMSSYAEWGNLASFEAIGDLLDEIVAEGGLVVRHLDNGELYVDIPFRRETMPVLG